MPPTRTLLAFFLCASVAAAADPARLRTLTGDQVEGDLVSLSDREIVLKADSGPRSVPLPQALALDVQPELPPAAGTRYTDVELTDGSLLHCSDFTLKNKEVELKLLGGMELKLPLASISYVLRDAQEGKVREEWQRLLAGRGNRDLLAARDKEGVVNAVPGTFGEGDDTGQSIEFEMAGGSRRRLNLARLHALGFFRQPAPDMPEALCQVRDTSGNLFQAAHLATSDKDFTVTLAAGGTVELPRPLLARLDFSKGKLTYLSDLEPKVTETYNLEGGEVVHYRRDRNLNNDPIQLDRPHLAPPPDKPPAGDSAQPERGVETYAKGLSLHAYTELVYDIGGQYEKFKCVLGVDPRVGDEDPPHLVDSHVKVAFEGDGRELRSFEVERKDGKVSVRLEGKELDGAVVLDVKNVKQLRIVVSSLGLTDLGAQVTLADARVSK